MSSNNMKNHWSTTHKQHTSKSMNTTFPPFPYTHIHKHIQIIFLSSRIKRLKQQYQTHQGVRIAKYHGYNRNSHITYHGSEGESHLVANIVKFTPINSLYATFTIEYTNTLMEETMNTKCLDFQIDIIWTGKKIFLNWILRFLQ